jgi:hypothetical protein
MNLVLATLSTLASLHLTAWADKIPASDLPPSVEPVITLAEVAPTADPRKPDGAGAVPETGNTPVSQPDDDAADKPVIKPAP